jgi:hypothetical protein
MRLGHSIISGSLTILYRLMMIARGLVGRARRVRRTNSQPTEPRESFASYAINKGLITDRLFKR